VSHFFNRRLYCVRGKERGVAFHVIWSGLADDGQECHYGRTYPDLRGEKHLV